MRLQTNNLFLDTSIFVDQNFFTGSKLLQIIEMGSSGYLRLVITQITYNEILNRINSGVKDSLSELKKFQKSKFILKNIEKCSALFDVYDADELTLIMTEKLNLLIKRGNVNILRYPTLNIENVFSRYFSNETPFQNAGKKSEFPDAFVLATVDQWCNENNIQCYCLSKDSDMLKGFSKNILTINDFSDFLDTLVRGYERHTQHEERVKEADALFEEKREEIIDIMEDEIILTLYNSLEGQFDNIGTQITDIEIRHLELLGQSMIFINEHFAKIEVDVEVTFVAFGEFEDDQNAEYNNITDEWDNIEIREERLYKNARLPIALTLNYNPPAGREFRGVEIDSVNNGRRILV